MEVHHIFAVSVSLCILYLLLRNPSHLVPSFLFLIGRVSRTPSCSTSTLFYFCLPIVSCVYHDRAQLLIHTA